MMTQECCDRLALAAIKHADTISDTNGTLSGYKLTLRTLLYRIGEIGSEKQGEELIRTLNEAIVEIK